MKRFVFLFCLVVFCSQAFCEKEWAGGFFGIVASFWEKERIDDRVFSRDDMIFSIESGQSILKNLSLNSEFGVHFISDRRDTSHLEYRVSVINSLVTLGFLPYILMHGDGHYEDEIPMKIFLGTLFLMNPTVEFFFWKGWVPVSVSAGYKMDWFAFSPGHKFYFRPHADLNINLMLLRVSASYAYVATNTYDIKRGPRFYLKVYFGWLNRNFNE
jgi:hypothetical protein